MIIIYRNKLAAALKVKTNRSIRFRRESSNYAGFVYAKKANKSTMTSNQPQTLNVIPLLAFI